MPDYDGRIVDLVVCLVAYLSTDQSNSDVDTSLVRTVMATFGFDALVLTVTLPVELTGKHLFLVEKSFQALSSLLDL